jgi:hypothetical protein
MQALHSSAVGGHSGGLATYQRIKSLFAWPGMRESINQFVQACTTCQQAKTEHVKSPSLLQTFTNTRPSLASDLPRLY